MMKASQEEAAGCAQGCPRQEMPSSWMTSRTQRWSQDACSGLGRLHSIKEHLSDD